MLKRVVDAWKKEMAVAIYHERQRVLCNVAEKPDFWRWGGEFDISHSPSLCQLMRESSSLLRPLFGYHSDLSLDLSRGYYVDHAVKMRGGRLSCAGELDMIAWERWALAHVDKVAGEVLSFAQARVWARQRAAFLRNAVRDTLKMHSVTPEAHGASRGWGAPVKMFRLNLSALSQGAFDGFLSSSAYTPHAPRLSYSGELDVIAWGRWAHMVIDLWEEYQTGSVTQ